MAEIDLEALAKRCEALEGPCRETDATIAWLTRWRWDGWDEDDVRIEARSLEYVIERVENGFNSIWRNIPRYTSSIDAAMTLAPEGWWLAACNFCPTDFRSDQDREWHAEFSGPISWVTFDDYPEPQYDCEGGNASTAARAITAAALRARLTEGEGE